MGVKAFIGDFEDEHVRIPVGDWHIPCRIPIALAIRSFDPASDAIGVKKSCIDGRTTTKNTL